MPRRLVLSLVVLWLCVPRLLAADPPLIALADVSQHVDQRVTIEFVVASSRKLDSGEFCFLNSKRQFTDADNFTVAIGAGALAKFAEQGIDDPAQHFHGKTIRATGKITLYKERPQIAVDDPKQVIQVFVEK